MGRERKITISVSSNSIVIEMIKKTLYQKTVILKNNFKIPFIPSFLFISIFFCLQKGFALLTYQFLSFQKKQNKKKTKKKKLCSHVCILLNVLKTNTF